MDYLVYIIPIIAVAVLSAGWAATQVLAKHLGTKNHIEHSSCCNGCTCMGNTGECWRDKGGN